MLMLDDDAWEQLEDAYGSAKNIPLLLRQLGAYPQLTDYRSEPYFSLWSALCHQGDIYTASYAAVPYLTSIVEAAPEKVHWSIAQLIVCIEIARLNGRGPKIPANLVDFYSDAIGKLTETVCLLHTHSPSKETVAIASAAFAASIGEGLYAKAVQELNPDISGEFLEWFFSR